MNAVNDTVMLTGGTGFVGSYLAVGLMKAGAHVVFVAREAGGITAAQRVRNILAWHGYTADERYSVVTGDLTLPHLGFSGEEYRVLARSCTEIWHCASETTFIERRRELLERVNVEGTRRIAEFLADSNVQLTNYVGTCYSVGRTAGRCEERLVAQDAFHNPYEATKHQAEALLIGECRRLGAPLLVYRPSIIAGEHRTGRTLLFNAMYYPLRVLDYLRREILTDWTDNGGRNARLLGASVSKGGRVRIPVRLTTTHGANSCLNVVPIDYVRDACLAIRERGASGKIYHVVNDRLVVLSDLASLVERVLKIDGVEVVGPRHGEHDPATPLEDQFNSRIRIYMPYIDDDREFTCDNTAAALAGTGLSPPRTDRAYLQTCLTYALAQHWSADPDRGPARAVSAR